MMEALHDLCIWVNIWLWKVVIGLGVAGVGLALHAWAVLEWQFHVLNNKKKRALEYMDFNDAQKLNLEKLTIESDHSNIRQLALLQPMEAPENYRKHLHARLKEARKRQAKLSSEDVRFVRLTDQIGEWERKLEASKDIQLSLPSAGDLREITLQTELSRTAPASLNTLVHILLVLGICGTLLGVHLALGKGYVHNIGMGDLKPALLPSMCAVIGTVVLIILRAIYAARVDRYLVRLDEWTRDFQRNVVPAQGNAAERQIEHATEGLEEPLKDWVKPETDAGKAARSSRRNVLSMKGISQQLSKRTTELTAKKKEKLESYVPYPVSSASAIAELEAASPKMTYTYPDKQQ